MESILMHPIGIIHSPYKNKGDAPMQGFHNMEPEGVIELFPQYVEGARDIAPGAWGQIVFHFHLAVETPPLITWSRKHQQERGVFSTRSPLRPNGIGISVVQFVRINGREIFFRGVDMVDGTPLLDIKPCGSIPELLRNDGRSAEDDHAAQDSGEVLL